MDDWQHTPPRAPSTSPTLRQRAEYFLYFARRTRIKVVAHPDCEHLGFIEPQRPQDDGEAWIWQACKALIEGDLALYAAVRELLLEPWS
jgi:hypothetical protein